MFRIRMKDFMIGEFVYTNDGQEGFIEMLGQNEFLFPVVIIKTSDGNRIVRKHYDCSRIIFKTNKNYNDENKRI